MMQYTEFDEATGRILSFGIMQEEVFRVKSNVIEGQYDDSLYYIVDNYPAPRPLFLPDKLTIIADGVDEITAGNLPIPFIISIDDASYEILDGELSFSTNVKGVYKIQANTFPYKDNIIEIEAI